VCIITVAVVNFFGGKEDGLFHSLWEE